MPEAPKTPLIRPGWGWFLYIALLLAWFVPPRLLAHLSFHTNDLDFGLYSNLVGNLASGHGFYSSILGRSHLGEHFSPIMIFFVPAAWLGVTPWALLLAQGLSAAITVAILTRLAEKKLEPLDPYYRQFFLVLLVLLFLFYRPLLAAWDFQFQPILLGAPLVAAALWAMDAARWRWLWILVPLLLLTRESAGLAVAGLGLVAALRYRRPAAAIALLVIGLALPVILAKWFIPWQRQGVWLEHMNRIEPLFDPPGKGTYFVKLLGPLGFLPLFGWREALGALPNALLNIAVNHRQQYAADLHYDAQLAVFVMLGAIRGVRPLVAWADRLNARRAGRGRWLIAAVVMLALFFQAQWQSSHPIRRYGKFWPQPGQWADHKALAPLAALPEEFLLSADPWIGPHLCGRPGYKTLYHANWHLTLLPGQLLVVRDTDEKARRLARLGWIVPLARHGSLVLLYASGLSDNDRAFVLQQALDAGWERWGRERTTDD